ncbi:CURVATURE THYLAKOID protein isoform X2 [Tasmannia lanceolata]|uniref:CURVATURE THYLAKOID protein isoform X2 n=1 Tax=Tasmannia lanceolata TaxID=3420 RepID=UPI004062CF69
MTLHLLIKTPEFLPTDDSVALSTSTYFCLQPTPAGTQMASTIAIPPASLFCRGEKTHCKTHRKFPIFGLGEKQGRVTVSVVAKAVGENSDLSNSQSIVKSVQNAWDKTEDRIALAGLGFAAVAALWTSLNLIGGRVIENYQRFNLKHFGSVKM